MSRANGCLGHDVGSRGERCALAGAAGDRVRAQNIPTHHRHVATQARWGRMRVSDLLGHRAAGTTDRYAKFDPTYPDQANEGVGVDRRELGQARTQVEELLIGATLIYWQTSLPTM